MRQTHLNFVYHPHQLALADSCGAADAVDMVMAEEGIDVSVAEAHAAMPFAREDPAILQADVFLQTFDMELQW